MGKRLEIENLTFSFKDKEILKEANYIFEEGNIYVVIAKNGEGKSTLFKLIGGEYKDYTGDIKGNANAMLHKQTPVYFEDMTVQENIETFIYCLNSKKKAKDVLEEYELTDIKNRVCRLLSGGEKQRLYIAITGLTEEDVYLYDEADSALDAIGRKFYYDILKKRAKEGKIVIAITHHLTEAINIADEVCFMTNNMLKRIELRNLPSDFMQYNEDAMLSYLGSEV
ncbi:MAG: ABC transporter ATP-binding protein [Lachnospiraceae bacterium]|nr:ABC transporter ATP-binding protein [Lachnospiraceae bacterium]